MTNILYYVALYLRLSKEDGDKEESESIKNQENLGIDFIEQLKKKEPQNTFKLFKIYIDDGFTGTNFNRPGFKNMINDIENKNINLVITKNLDRLGRNIAEVCHYYEDYFPNNNVRYMTILDGIDTFNPLDDDIHLKFKMVTDEYYPKRLSKNIKATKLRNTKHGYFIGSIAPYGYKKSSSDNYKLVIDEEVAPVIRKIFNMYSNHFTRFEIVKELNKLKILPPRKHLDMEKTEKGLYKVNKNDYSWKESTISRIISNPVYIRINSWM